GIRLGPPTSVRRVGGKRPAGAPELGSNHRVAAECAPRARKRFSETGSAGGERHERQREGAVARALIDAAGEPLMSALKNPAKKASRLAFRGRSSHVRKQFNKNAS